MLTDKQRATWYELINRMPRLNGEWLYRAEIKTVRAVAAHLAALEAEHEAAAVELANVLGIGDYEGTFDAWRAAHEAVDKETAARPDARRSEATHAGNTRL